MWIQQSCIFFVVVVILIRDTCGRREGRGVVILCNLIEGPPRPAAICCPTRKSRPKWFEICTLKYFHVTDMFSIFSTTCRYLVLSLQSTCSDFMLVHRSWAGKCAPLLYLAGAFPDQLATPALSKSMIEIRIQKINHYQPFNTSP